MKVRGREAKGSGRKSSKEIVAEMLQKLERGKKADELKKREQQRREALLALETPTPDANAGAHAPSGGAGDGEVGGAAREGVAKKGRAALSEESDSSDSDLELEMKVRLKRQASGGSGSITPPTSATDARARRMSDALTSAMVAAKRQKVDVTSPPITVALATAAAVPPTAASIAAAEKNAKSFTKNRDVRILFQPHLLPCIFHVTTKSNLLVL